MDMTINFDSNKIPSRQEREELVLDLHFNQNKNYREISKIVKMSVRDIGEIVKKAYQEKERQEHKSLSVQAYELFSNGNTLLEVAIKLNLGQVQTTQYYWEYLKLRGFDDIAKIYQELQGSVWYFVKLCKEAKAAKMGIPQVINLLRIANSSLPSVQHRYEQLQEQNNQLESILRTKSMELQSLNNQITDTTKFLDITNSECRLKTSMLQTLEQAAKMEAFVNNYKNNDQEYTKLKKSIEDKVRDALSDKKRFLELASFSVIESMRASPDRYSSLVYHNNNENSSKDNNNHNSSSRQILAPPPYDGYIIEHYKSTLFEESEKLYNGLVDLLVCEVVNESVIKQSVPMPSQLPAFPSEEVRGVNDDKQN
jgi:transposase